MSDCYIDCWFNLFHRFALLFCHLILCLSYISCCFLLVFYFFVFFFQAEDGIRDIGVTGVQTCALPICASRVVDRLTSARLLQARGRHNGALRLLETLRVATEAAGRTGDLLVILALKALVLWAKNEKERAVGTLTRALALAEPEGYVRTFVDEGAPMGDLLSATLEARQSGRLDAAGRISVTYLARLLAAVAQEATAPAADEIGRAHV